MHHSLFRKFSHLTLLAVFLVGGLLAAFPPQLARAANKTVNTTADNESDGCAVNNCTLREAIADATAGDTIVFSVTGTIILTNDLLTIDKNLTIAGPGASQLAISNNNGRVFGIVDVEVTLSGLTIRDGNMTGGGSGGGISSGGTLTVINSTFSGNQTDGGGGGIANFGTLIVANSTFSGNSDTCIEACDGGGGGVILNIGTLTVTNSTFSGNSTTTVGGGIANYGTLIVANSTFSGNSATTGGAIFNDSLGTTTIKNSIFANSVSGGNCSGTITNSGNNLDVGTTCGFGSTNGSLSSTNPQLGTLTGSPAYFPIINNSPAIDGVTYNAPNDCPSTDQRGLNRDDLGCDIGAFEFKYADGDTVIKSIASAGGDYTFGPTMVKIEVAGPTTCLTGITIQRTNANHPNATDPLKTGHWWAITPAGCSSGFSVGLTLPTDFVPDNDGKDNICRWNPGGPGAQWDCAWTSNTSNSITRSPVTAFSEWAAGNNVNPTLVKMKALDVSSRTSGEWNGGWVALLAGALLTCGGLFVLRRRKTG